MIDADIFKENSLLRFKTFNRMPGRRKLPVTDEIAERYLSIVNGVLPGTLPVEEWKALVEKTRKELSVSKRLISIPELDEIVSNLAAIRMTVLSYYCNLSGFDDGLYLIKTVNIGQAQEYVNREIEKVKRLLVPKLQAVYPAKVEEIRRVWGKGIADLMPVVERLPELFGCTTIALQFKVPEGLPPELREAEEKKLREQFETARTTIIAALWEEFQGLIDRLIDRLTPEPDGTAKTFKRGTIENIQTFVEAFSNRNAFNDDRLNALVQKAQGILSAVGRDGEIPQRLRDYDNVREATREAFASIKADVDKGVEDVASRMFSFED